ncbi:MAG: thiosulfate oxidation carrier protein SoxY [Rhodocyclaceae bacterium]|jgi:sulfur-oxidizing protein SoxY|nr:thiosulfate oxidation carrier protein SoxY [Rhodocyclaceae bacterium]
MNPLRRHFLHNASGTAAVAALLAAGLLKPGRVLAAWNAEAFEAHTIGDALKRIGADKAAPSPEILLKAPEIADNGSSVAVEVISRIPATQRISLLVDKNPQPLILQMDFSPGAKPQLGARIKMAETSNLRAVVEAGGKTYTVLREVQVTIGGCGG